MSDKSKLEQAQKICRYLLDMDPPATDDKIRESVNKVRKLIEFTSEEEDLLLRKLQESTSRDQDPARILDNGNIEPWVVSKWAESPSKRKFWKRYVEYLTDEEKFAPVVIKRLDEITDKILDRLADPERHDIFDKRGLVVGHVQSGKTSSYIGLINKAADAGYKVIVILAGIHSTLRSQTQLRVDQGFLGYDTVTNRSFDQNNNLIGVGKFDSSVAAHSLTSSAINGDFKKGVANTVNISLRGSDPVVIVIKKNTSVLKNLIDWLSGKEGEDHENAPRTIKDIPLLLIDDEADNASINISKTSVSSINGSIRTLLQLFHKSAYVGYTATPYANVFIPHPEKAKDLHKNFRFDAGRREYPVGEDLFPKDFIINIPPPSNYVGPEKFFGILSENAIYEQPDPDDDNDTTSNSLAVSLYEPIKDYQPAEYHDNKKIIEEIRRSNTNYIPDKHFKDDKKPDELPESLKKAIKCFILTCAARRVRGQINVHNSMLVHVTRFVNWQNEIALLVSDELDRYRNRIEFGNKELAEDLRHIWETDFVPVTKKISATPGTGDAEMIPVSWDILKPELYPAVAKIRVRAVHGSTLLGGLEPENIQAIDYYENRIKGLSVIAIGGNKLSRGLTLEGLSISYFLRASKMYDTLMQMGRWFGYRPGYLDLCRLFTSAELISYYKHITAATEEMRAEFDRMWLMHETPLNYGLKIQAHTGVLTITASNRFRYKKMMYLGFSGELEETWQFNRKEKGFFNHNYNITRDFICSLGTPSGPANSSVPLRKQSYIWQGKNNYREVASYLENYLIRQQSFYPNLMKEYILKQAEIGKLTDWTIALIHNSTATGRDIVNVGGYEVGLSYRKDDSENPQFYELAKAHIIGNFHEYADLTDPELTEALKRTSEDRVKDGKDPETAHPGPTRIREVRPEKRALLLIYLLNPRPDKEGVMYSDVPITGLAISFPTIKDEKKIPYAVNDIFQKEYLDYPEELDTDDLPSEDDEENDSKSAVLSHNRLGKETFLSLIENTASVRLDETEFRSGIIPVHPRDKDIGSEIIQKKNLLLPTTEEVVQGVSTVPFYPEDDIHQYYLSSAPEYFMANPDDKNIITGEYVTGLKRSRYVTFSFSNLPAVFSDGCWIIQSGRFNARYLVALFNSTLFGAWVRVNGEQKKDVYFIKNDVLYSFPIILPAEEHLWLFENLYELLVAAGRKEHETGKGTMKSYYANILDAFVFTCYFPGSMEKEKETLYKELEQIVPRELPTGSSRTVLAEELFDVLYDRRHPVRETLYYLDRLNKISRIKSVFTS